MARNTQLSSLLVMLRQELGRSTNVAVGVDDALGLRQKLRRSQELLYDDYDWPFLRSRFTLPMNATQRFYNMPTSTREGYTGTLNIERIEHVAYYYNNIPRPIERGIMEEDFRSFNSDIGVVSSPALKWDIRWTGSVEQIEIWPIPASNGDTLVFRGIRQLRQLINDNDVADIDDQAIVLMTATELLAKGDSASSQVLGRLAAKRISTIQKRQRGGSKRYRLGMGETNPQRPMMVVVRTS